MAALCAAARHGFEVSDALDVAANTSVELGVKIHDKNNNALASALEQLPDSCVAAAQELEKDRLIYTSKSVFSDNIVDYMLKYLRSFDDANLRASLKGNNAQTMALVNSNIHVG